MNRNSQSAAGTAMQKKRVFKEKSLGLLFILPAVLGILLFNALPILQTIVYSFSDFRLVTGVAEHFTLQNYVEMFTVRSQDFWTALKVTGLYTVVNVPLTLVLSFLLALFLNYRVRGQRLVRVLVYLPCLIPVIVSGMLWKDITNYEYGVLNTIAEVVLHRKLTFFAAENTALPTLIFINLFGLGGSMILWIAQLNNIPKALTEASQLDGAGPLRRLCFVIVPMCSPMIFYNLIMGVIGALQTFNIVFILGGGSFGHKGLFFYVYHIYDMAFGTRSNTGYAYALSTVLFLIIGLLTLVIFKTSKWVFYGEES